MQARRVPLPRPRPRRAGGWGLRRPRERSAPAELPGAGRVQRRTRARSERVGGALRFGVPVSARPRAAPGGPPCPCVATHRATRVGVRGGGGWSPGLRTLRVLEPVGSRTPWPLGHPVCAMPESNRQPPSEVLGALPIELIACHTPPAEPVVSKHACPKRGRVDGRRRMAKDAEGLEPSRRAPCARAARRGRPLGPSCVCGCQRAARDAPSPENQSKPNQAGRTGLEPACARCGLPVDSRGAWPLAYRPVSPSAHRDRAPIALTASTPFMQDGRALQSAGAKPSTPCDHDPGREPAADAPTLEGRGRRRLAGCAADALDSARRSRQRFISGQTAESRGGKVPRGQRGLVRPEAI